MRNLIAKTYTIQVTDQELAALRHHNAKSKK